MEQQLQTPTEKVIYNTIEKQIGAGNISIEDDFVNDLGIDSLMMAKINSELNFYNIKIQDIFCFQSHLVKLNNFHLLLPYHHLYQYN